MIWIRVLKFYALDGMKRICKIIMKKIINIDQ
jgi:hypothetical protein